MKALIVEPSSLGEAIHALPVLDVLRRRGWEVGWLAEGPATLLLEKLPQVSPLVRTSGGGPLHLQRWRGAVDALRAEKFEVALDLDGSWKSAVWARLSKAPRIIGHAAPWRGQPLSSAFVREPVDMPEGANHDIDRNLSLLRLLGIDAIGLRDFPLPSSDSEQPAVESFLQGAGLSSYVLLNPGGEWPSRLWSPGGFGAVARGLRELGIPSIVTYGAGQERLAERVVSASEGAAILAPPFPITGFMELARKSRVLVAAGAGALHLACAMGVPVVAIYGPTNPERSGPFDSRDIVVRRTPLCSPCYKRRCRIHDGVMDAITAPDVLNAVERRLGLTAAQRSLAV